MKFGLLCVAFAFLTNTAIAQVTGSGTTNRIPLWKSSTSLGSSDIVQVPGPRIGIGPGAAQSGDPTAKLEVRTSFPVAFRAVNISFEGNAVMGDTFGRFSAAVQGFAHNGGTGVQAISVGAEDNGITEPQTAIGLFAHASAFQGFGGAVAIVGQVSDLCVDPGPTPDPLPRCAGARFRSDSGRAPAAIFQAGTASGAVGDIMVGETGSSRVFRVDGAGNIFAAKYNVGGADFAESLPPAQQDARYEPGDLLVIGAADMSVEPSSAPYSTRVAGIYSTKPGVVASTHSMDDPRLATEIPVAVVGVVPCKVTAENGPIRSGDLLVSSSLPGHAMRATDRSKMLGAVVGKALQPLNANSGVIQVLITLH
jgi:hypothetical protein